MRMMGQGARGDEDMQPVDKIRYAFERDMMRRMPRKHDILRECGQCGTDITGSHAARKFCEPCSKQRRRDQTRRHVATHRERNPEPEYQFTMVDKDNLVTALIRACVQERLQVYAANWLPLHAWQAERWLLDCAEPYMAAIGEHINIDRILEKIDDQKS